MDVELPNGKVIQGVPEGTPKEEIMRKAISAGIATETDFAPIQTQAETSAASPSPREDEEAPEWVRAVRNMPPMVAADMIGSIVSGVGGQIAGGLRGIYETASGGAEAGTEAVEETSQALSYRPRTEAGQAGLEALGKIGPVWEGLQNLMGTGAEEMGRLVGIQPGTEEAARLYALGSAMPDAVGLLSPAGRAKPSMKAPPVREPAQVEGIAKAIEKASKEGMGRKGRSDRAAQSIAEEVRPQREVVGAFEQVGIPAESVPPEVLSGNQAFRELAGTARSVPGSELSQRYRQFMEDLSRRADEVSRAADAEDIGTVNARVEEGLAEKINRAGKIESQLYTKVEDAIAPSTPVDVTPITNALRSRIEEVGGDMAELSPMERRLVGRFMQKQDDGAGGIAYVDKPKTWSAISGLRKELNAARGGKSTFGDAASYDLNRYGSLVSGTQRRIAEDMGFGDDYAAAMKATGVK
ncbi:hypothetical protein, partial [Alcanivorax sp. HI0007]